ncbi:septal ring factor EnvC (AmiA/AmiB activator) [Scopulibacillus darangshiensis]|uniref:Septal ring factor EnvC (AmiA/AmiB activator) n=1 Tax=Scopulibacillus darangshiensis TaxID=442528 RepID=A0A4R2NU37_9BACL|nr:M23 family metallopeptidase [Scopulibacillus darangshiensis]TCP24895.1 septal ring factor EnvC (AmiA/AmiB activator) [Scopulibacillus darangshiensis]
MKSTLLRTTMVFGLTVSTALAYSGVSAYAETSSDIQQKINNVQKKQEQNQSDLNKSKKELQSNNNKQQSVASQIQEVDENIENLNVKITGKENQVADTKKEIEHLNKEIDAAKERIKKRDRILKERVKTMYINGGSVKPMEVLLGAKSFGDFVDRVLALNTIAKQDKKLLREQQEDKKLLEEKQAQVKQKLDQIKADLADMKSMKADLDQQKAKKQSLLKDLKSKASELHEDVVGKQEQADILASQEQVLKNNIAKLKAQEEARKKAQEEAKRKAAAAKEKEAKQSAPVSRSSDPNPAPATTRSTQSAPESSANFIMPAAGVISSGFGARDGGFHPGIDIASSTGTPIHAAADGVVFRAYHSSSYGNCVMITHRINGHTYTTVYAHMSGYNVSAGQAVSQGQTIGAMGSTGDSTGPHLHFELYQGPWTPPPHNGAVNPLNYIG